MTTFSEYFDSNLFLDYLKFARPSDDSNDILPIFIDNSDCVFIRFCNHTILFAKVEN